MADMTLATALQKGRELFGQYEASIFEEGGLWFVGRFLDDGFARSPDGKLVRLPPYSRVEEIFGCGPTLRDAFAFCDGSRPLYSIPGISPGPKGARGMTVVKNKYGQIAGFLSPAGVFTRHFPRG